MAILAGYSKYGACFSTNFHKIIYTALSTDICSHYGTAGFQPAIQQIIFYDGANYLRFANDLAMPLRPTTSRSQCHNGLKPINFQVNNHIMPKAIYYHCVDHYIVD